nr:immunoglobulin light chain junction region [Macaca mulatta]MOX51747.1 immunoglobulin light chain junction region [Macaca mulatta]MOX52325.1 immunoglobulin light chain junction region [Macaca mulatta]MOX52434.1 immunoglobulin light chain junction region [Macaca mulatta]MOX52825.1 immunoglobulin light chain junction region [Macaca mulatta]
CMQYRYIPPTI